MTGTEEQARKTIIQKFQRGETLPFGWESIGAYGQVAAFKRFFIEHYGKENVSFSIKEGPIHNTIRAYARKDFERVKTV